MNLKAQLAQLLFTVKKIESVELCDNDNFLEKLDFDSLESVELIMMLNQKFGITYGDEPSDFDDINQFGSFVDAIGDKINNAS